MGFKIAAFIICSIFIYKIFTTKWGMQNQSPKVEIIEQKDQEDVIIEEKIEEITIVEAEFIIAQQESDRGFVICK